MTQVAYTTVVTLDQDDSSMHRNAFDVKNEQRLRARVVLYSYTAKSFLELKKILS